MRIKNKALSVGYKLALALVGLACLLVQAGVLRGEFDLSMFRFFTLQSNLLCVIYFTCDAVWLLRDKARAGGDVWRPTLKGIQMMGITVTWLVAHFLLPGFTMGGVDALAVTGLHYVVPIMTILDWLLFDKKGWMRPYSPLLWTAFPLLYFGYAMLAARVGDGIGYGGSRYPYPFIDVDKLGWPTVLLTTAALVTFFIALGYLFYFIDRTLKRLEKN